MQLLLAVEKTVRMPIPQNTVLPIDKYVSVNPWKREQLYDHCSRSRDYTDRCCTWLFRDGQDDLTVAFLNLCESTQTSFSRSDVYVSPIH